MTWVWIGLAGVFGGVAPNLFRLGTDLTSGRPLPGPSYLIGLAIFMALGFVVAVTQEEQSLKKAFLLGLAIPAMFQAGAQDLSAKSVQASTVLSLTQATTVTVHAEHDVQVVFHSPDGNRKETVSAHAGSVQLDVPAFAGTIQILYKGAESDALLVTPRAVFDVAIIEEPWSGIKRAAGLSTTDYRVTLTERKEK